MSDNYETSILSGNRRLPKIFRKELVRTLEFSDYVAPVEREGVLVHDKRKIPKNVNKKFDRIGDTTFRSQVGFIVPQKTKNRMQEAEKYFEKPNLYFIAEVKPEDWNATRLINEDPLVVGLSKGGCYFVDSFNPTALENEVAVRNNYTEKPQTHNNFSQN